eukprot:TRINITY_DN23506_c0_g1_i1.p1 TRINITY_DN23506_c0_g1~~TRINITY_DN23506_c0_g1_i1.p1  ORF type:complete len:133 (+),score=32.67 TRINITY_DN23506_c0_g1_i1:33-401(+)
MVSLLGNPVTEKENYRLYIIFKLPKLKLLDFVKVKPTEKREARQLFGGEQGKAALENTVSKTSTSISAPKQKVSIEAEAIKKAIAEARTLEEVQDLKRTLQSGKFKDTATKSNKMEVDDGET